MVERTTVTFYVDDDRITVPFPPVSVREILRRASKASREEKFADVLISPDGVEYFNLNIRLMPRDGTHWTTRKH